MTSAISATPAPATAASTGDSQQIRKVAKQFEAVFLRQMIGSMRSANLGEGVFDSSATDQFRDMADARTADSMAEKGGFGMADLLMRQFQAKAVATPAAKAAPSPVVESPE